MSQLLDYFPEGDGAYQRIFDLTVEGSRNKFEVDDSSGYTALHIISENLAEGFGRLEMLANASEGIRFEQNGNRLVVNTAEAALYNTLGQGVGVNPSGYVVTHPSAFRSILGLSPIASNPVVANLSQSGATLNQVIQWNGSAWAPGTVASGGGSWGSIAGTLSAQTDLQNALNLKANLASPTFSGTVTAPGIVAAYQVETGGPTIRNTGGAVNFRTATNSADAPFIAGGTSSTINSTSIQALIVNGSGTSSRIAINGPNNNSGLLLQESGVNRWSIASYTGGRFTFFNETANGEALGITASGSRLLVNGVTDDTTTQFQVQGGGRFTGNLTASGTVNNNPTWNNVATVFTGIDQNVTWTNAANGSSVFRLRVDGTNCFDLRFPFGKAGPLCMFMDNNGGNIHWIESNVWKWRTNGQDRLHVGDVGLIVSPLTLAGSAATSGFAFSQTWNTTGTPTAFDINITDTASNANSILQNWRVNAASAVAIYKNGNIVTGGTYGGGLTVQTGGVVQAIIGMHATANANGVHLSSGRPITWSNGQAGGNAVYTSLNCPSAGVVQIGTTVSNSSGTLEALRFNVGNNRGYLTDNGSEGRFQSDSGTVRFVFGVPRVSIENAAAKLAIGPFPYTVGFGYSASGTAEINDGQTTGTFRDLNLRNLTASGQISVTNTVDGGRVAYFRTNAATNPNCQFVLDSPTNFNSGLVLQENATDRFGIFYNANTSSGSRLADTFEVYSFTSSSPIVRLHQSAGLAISVDASSNTTVVGSLTSTVQNLSTDPVMGTDLTAGQTRIIKNTSTGVVKGWVNDGGTPKSVTYSP